MKSGEKALPEMKSDEKALFEIKNDEKALSDEELKSFVGGLDCRDKEKRVKTRAAKLKWQRFLPGEAHASTGVVPYI